MWNIPDYIDLTSVDKNWNPIGDIPYVYHFLSQHRQTDSTRLSVGSSGVTYTMPGATQIQIVYDKSVKAIAVPQRWSVPNHIDLTSVDFTWHPNAFDPPYIYHFGSKHQKSTGLTYTAPGATEIKFVKPFDVCIKSVPIFYMDFMNPESASQLADLRKRYPEIKSTRYVSDHLNVLKRIMNLAESEFVWVISSVCDYADFDFTWHPEHWQEDMIHCFPSGKQKRGDTFYINVDSFKTQMYNLEMLDWFNVINYCSDQMADRILDPTVYYETDDLVSVIKNYDFKFPYATFSNQPTSFRHWQHYPCLWAEKDRSVESFTRSNSVCVVPRDVKAHLRTQLYDYPHIDKAKNNTFASQLQDVVFISYDEPDADQNWEILQARCPEAQRIHGVDGMELALEAAANLSSTPWYYAVFAKTRLHEQFDFSFVPDYMQQPKHYIFNCRNTTNGLEYGHMGIVLYNCNGVKQVNGSGDFGLDYTLSFPHESVPILSCHGDFATTPYHAWRTAFRETAKLTHFESQTPTVEGAYRLNRWLKTAQGVNAEWCLKGASDGYEFFKTTQGDLVTLKQSFKWEWLRSYFNQRYGELN